MPVVTIEALVADSDAAAVFARISDFASYSEHTEAVREITVIPVDENVLDSTWLVNFRSGTVRWTERDHIHPSERTIWFEQISGDFETLTGEWKVTEETGGVRIAFSTDFDLGMPSIASIIDPIAERTLADNTAAILRGLFGDAITVLGTSDLRNADFSRAALFDGLTRFDKDGELAPALARRWSNETPTRWRFPT